MRSRMLATDVLLLGAVVLWAFNFPVTKYLLRHFDPLAYGAVRYGAAAVLMAALVLAAERTLAVRGSWRLVALAVGTLLLNQVCFVYALDLTTAATAALILGTTPVFTVLISHATGVESLSARFWIAATVSFGGVALVAAGSGGELSGDLGGNLLAVGMAATWAAYSVSIAPLMVGNSPYRVSALVLVALWPFLLALAAPQLADQEVGSLGVGVWAALAYAVVGPLVLTNLLWFTAIGRVGPSHAAIFGNLLPFAAALLAVALLDESLSAAQVVGGALIALGIVVVRSRSAAPN
ncbi:MAG TPA: DMT family transporter [Gaiellaceae bacterium]|nr:DMT family transporter [Gaiellaceae bacterium]